MQKKFSIYLTHTNTAFVRSRWYGRMRMSWIFNAKRAHQAQNGKSVNFLKISSIATFKYFPLEKIQDSKANIKTNMISSKT